MERLLRWKRKARPSKLLFGTSAGKPDYHLLDRLKAIAKRAGLDPTTARLQQVSIDGGDHLAALGASRRQGLGYRMRPPATRLTKT